MAYSLRTIAVALLLPIMSALSSAQSPPSGDTYAASGAPSKNYGTNASLSVLSGTISYIQFDLSNLPPGVTVNKATLRLYVNAVSANGSFDVFQVNAAWSESALTYNTRPGLGPSATGGAPIAVAAKSANNFLQIDITNLVSTWVVGSVQNYGVALQLSGSAGGFSFDSKESTQTSHEPELLITLNGPAGPQGATGATGPVGSVGPQGVAGVTGPVGPVGPQGLVGPVGPQGAVGAVGPVGPQGATGAIGINDRGSWNSTTTYQPNDAVADSGSYWLAVASNANSLPATTNPSWELLAAAGAQGPAGPPGATGATGPVGSVGPQGVAGVTGPVGPVGPQGLLGPVGPQGAVGAVGPVGPQGAIGAIGINDLGAWNSTTTYQPNDAVADSGSYWLAVASNANSLPATTNPSWELLAAAGAQGPAGPPGATGATGSVGSVGPQGVAGVTGPMGPAGPQGLVGPVGPNVVNIGTGTNIAGVLYGTANQVVAATASNISSLLTGTQPFAVTTTYNGPVPSQTSLIYVPVPVAVSVPANCSGSYLFAKAAATNLTVFQINVTHSGIATPIGTATFAAGATLATFSCNATGLVPGDIIELVGGGDSTLATIGGLIYGLR